MALGWRQIYKSSGGHRFFVLGDDLSAVAVADSSGSTPERTEDGVLWLDKNRKLMLGSLMDAPHRVDVQLCVPVLKIDGQLSCIIEPVASLRFLVEFGFAVEVNLHVKQLLEAMNLVEFSTNDGESAVVVIARKDKRQYAFT